MCARSPSREGRYKGQKGDGAGAGGWRGPHTSGAEGAQAAGARGGGGDSARRAEGVDFAIVLHPAVQARACRGARARVRPSRQREREQGRFARHIAMPGGAPAVQCLERAPSRLRLALRGEARRGEGEKEARHSTGRECGRSAGRVQREAEGRGPSRGGEGGREGGLRGAGCGAREWLHTGRRVTCVWGDACCSESLSELKSRSETGTGAAAGRGRACMTASRCAMSHSGASSPSPKHTCPRGPRQRWIDPFSTTRNQTRTRG